VFSNHLKKVTVLRWENCTDAALMQDLADSALSELSLMGCETLIYDMACLPIFEGSPSDVQTRLHCVESGLVRRWGTVSVSAEPKEHPEVRAVLEELAIPAHAGPSFISVAEGLDAFVDEPDERLLAGPLPQGFYATYGGSIYSLPELAATVVRTAGNCADLPPVTKLFKDAIALSHKTGANLLIIDTSATRPIADMTRWAHVRDDVTVPVKESGLFQNVIHVRVGDDLTTVNGPPIEPLIRSFGIPYYAVTLMSEALAFAKVLRDEES
jgi:hypothetical protein